MSATITEEDAFLVDILAHPHDPTARLVYADWLADRDDARAPFVRRGVELGLHLPGDRTRPEEERFRGELSALTSRTTEYLGLPLTWGHLTTVFLFRLAETIAWCRPRVGQLQQGIDEIGWIIGGDQRPSVYELGGMDHCRLTSRRVGVERSELLDLAGTSPRRPASSLEGGRLLVCPRFQPIEAELAADFHRHAGGFLDASGSPPYDAWIVRVMEDWPAGGATPVLRLYALLWVPPAFVASVDRALHSQPGLPGEWAMCWPEHLASSTPLLDRARERGLML